MQGLSLILATSAYVAALYLLLTRTRVAHKTRNHYVITIACFVIAIIGHGIVIYNTMFIGQINLALGLMLSLSMLITCCCYLLASIINPAVFKLGIVIVPITLLASIIGYFFPGEALKMTDISSPIRWHMLLAIPAFVVVCLAFAQALLLLYQDYKLRSKIDVEQLSSLPAVETMDSILKYLIILSVVLLTFNVLFGLFSVYTLEDIELRFSHHLLFALFAWALTLTLLIGRVYYGWRGTVAASWSIAIYVLILIAYFGTRFVTEVVLG